MAQLKTGDNQPITLSNEDLIRRLDHLDDITHRIDTRVTDILLFIDEHRPALARGLSLMDPGAKLRGLVTGRKKP